MHALASVVGVFGDILGIAILAIVAICIYFVSQLFIGHSGRSQWLDEEDERARAKGTKRAA